MKLLIEGEITERSADDFVRRVEGCHDREIEVLIDSTGGSVNGALRMAGALAGSNASVRMTLCTADSSALLLIIGADRTVAASDASALCHDLSIDVRASHGATGAELRGVADDLARKKSWLSDMLGRKTNQGPLYWGYIMSRNERLTATQLRNYKAVERISALTAEQLRRQLTSPSPLPSASGGLPRRRPSALTPFGNFATDERRLLERSRELVTAFSTGSPLAFHNYRGGWIL